MEGRAAEEGKEEGKEKSEEEGEESKKEVEESEKEGGDESFGGGRKGGQGRRRLRVMFLQVLGADVWHASNNFLLEQKDYLRILYP